MNSPWYRVADGLFAGRRPREDDTPPAPPDDLVIIDLTGTDDGSVLIPAAFTGARRVVHPIPDFATPPAEQVASILDDVDEALAEHVVLVHCRAGIGRTGVVVGCWLARHGLDDGDALARLAALRSVLGPDVPRSPETASQRALVASWEQGR